MNRVVITLHPARSDDAMLRVEEAMQHVLDAMKVFADAEQALGDPRQAFVWRLEKASTNSPFTVVAVAEAINPTVDVSAHVRRVEREVAGGFRDLIENRRARPWMTPATISVVQGLLARSTNGIGLTEFDFEDGEDHFAIDSSMAKAGLQAIEGINALDVSDLAERQAYGELEGTMVAAGRYRGRPAIQIRSDLYNFVWCLLSAKLVERFGGEHRMADVWEGKTVGVTGTLHYERGGKLSKLEAHDIREIAAPRPLDLKAIFDADFTAGLEPGEYLDQLHEGTLA